MKSLFHKATPLFAKNIYDRIALVNNNWLHFETIQRIEGGAFKQNTNIIRNVSPIENYYIHFPAPSSNKIKNILEYNGPTNFFPLVQKGVDVHCFQPGEKLDTKTQTKPDNILDFKNSTFEDKRTHGVDSKAYENPKEFESKIFSQLSKAKYERGIRAMENLITINIIDMTLERYEAIRNALNLLVETCDNLVEHQLVWAANLHHFPDKYIPPIKIPTNFSFADLCPEISLQIKKSEIKMKLISDRLYFLKAPENDLKRSITEYFADSEIQRILSQE